MIRQAAHGGGWIISSASVSVGTTITFSIDVPSNVNRAKIITGYKADTSERAAVSLAVNGTNYSTIDMTGNTGYTETGDNISVIDLYAGGVNTLTYTVTRAGYLTFDYISLEQESTSLGSLTGTVFISESFSNVTDNFGFTSNATVADGVLRITENMSNDTTAVKIFDERVISQKAVDVTFEWKTDMTIESRKAGIEFRDLYGRIIFAVATKAGNVLRYSTTGINSDSSQCEYSWEPQWTEVAMDGSKTYTVHLIADFNNSVVSYCIVEKDSGNVLIQNLYVSTAATSFARMVGCNYYTEGCTATQKVDNFKLIGVDGRTSFPYSSKTVYAFGDSIVDGHKYRNAGFVQFLAATEGMTVGYDAARNGATIMTGGSGGQILSQIMNAPATSQMWLF